MSLSSAESELHSMVSGCSDGIYIKRFLEFILTGKEVDHYQWTDNSAARQLVLTNKALGGSGILAESYYGCRTWSCPNS